MAKIVKTTRIAPPLVNEAGLLRHLSKYFTGDAVTSSAATSPAPEEPAAVEAEPSAVNSKLLLIASRALRPAAGSMRFVLYLPYRDLVELYLKSGGGVAAASEHVFDDAELQELVNDPAAGNSKLVQMSDNFSFKEQLTVGARFKGDTVVLMDIPKNLIGELKSCGQDMKKAREILKKFMSHRFYVMTLNVARAARLPAALNQSSNFETIRQHFDPNVIENYPSKMDKSAAMDEWDEIQEELATRRASRGKRASKSAEQSKEPQSSTAATSAAAVGQLKELLAAAKKDPKSIDPELVDMIKDIHAQLHSS